MRRIDRPEPGYFRRRFVRGGPWVPGIIWRPCPWVEPAWDVNPSEWCTPYDRASVYRLKAAWGDKPADPLRVWTGGQPITRAEWRYLMDVRAWAIAHAPAAPEANPHQAVDIASLPPPLF